ncbi:MAG: glycosyltransferase family 39 protein [Chloroflexi bacterium]|nr:glycosyltransferase family 39 protein [Chloroflexota bacterium]
MGYDIPYPHLMKASKIGAALRTHILLGHFRFGDLVMIKDNYPPFVKFVTAPFFSIFGTDTRTAGIAAASFVLLLFAGIFYTCKYFGGRTAGWAGIFLAAGSPLLMHEARSYGFDVPLAAMFSLCIFFMIKSGGFKSRIYSVLFGAAFGFAMMTKYNCIFYILPFMLAGVIPPLFGSFKNKILPLVLLLFFTSAAAASGIIIQLIQSSMTGRGLSPEAVQNILFWGLTLLIILFIFALAGIGKNKSRYNQKFGGLFNDGGFDVILNIFLSVSTAALIALPWHSLNFDVFLEMFDFHFSANVAGRRHYLALFYQFIKTINNFFPFASLFLFAGLVYIFIFERKREALLLASGLVFGILFMTYIIVEMEGRYALPLMGFVVPLSLMWLSKLRRGVKIAILVLSIAWAAHLLLFWIPYADKANFKNFYSKYVNVQHDREFYTLSPEMYNEIASSLLPLDNRDMQSGDFWNRWFALVNLSPDVRLDPEEIKFHALKQGRIPDQLLANGKVTIDPFFSIEDLLTSLTNREAGSFIIVTADENALEEARRQLEDTKLSYPKRDALKLREKKKFNFLAGDKKVIVGVYERPLPELPKYSGRWELGADKPLLISAGPDGNIYVITEGSKILCFDTGGRLISTGGVPTGIKPSAIAAGASGGLYISGNDNTIYRMSLPGKHLTKVIRAPAGTGEIKSVAVSPGGKIYFTDGSGRIFRIDGSVINTIGPGKEERISGLYWKKYRYYAWDNISKKVLVVDAGPCYIEMILGKIPGGKSIRSIDSVVVDDDFSCYILDLTSKSVHMYDREGVYIGAFGGFEKGSHALSDPVVLAVSNDGKKIFIADKGASAIIIYGK